MKKNLLKQVLFIFCMVMVVTIPQKSLKNARIQAEELNKGAMQVEPKSLFLSDEIDATPVIQTVKIGEELSQELKNLFTDIKGSGVKLKTDIEVNSSKVGFYWVKATLIDRNLNEKEFEIPVNIYNPESTTLDQTNKMAIDAQSTTVFQSELEKNTKPIEEVILEKIAPKSWNMENGMEYEVSNNGAEIAGVGFTPGKHNVLVSGLDKLGNRSVVSTIDLTIKGDEIGRKSDQGDEFGSKSDFFERDDFRIDWTSSFDNWSYTYKDKSWIYNDSIYAELIVNGELVHEYEGLGFLSLSDGDEEMAELRYYKNNLTQTLTKSFIYSNVYLIKIKQQLLEDNAVELTYEVTNMDNESKKIGVSQYADVLVGNDSVEVTPIDNFKGINLTYGEDGLVIRPDPETMPNWVANQYNFMEKFRSYSQENSRGLGWESGKQYVDDSGKSLSPPVSLKENEPVNVGDSAVAMKNPGVDVEPNQTTSFKQTIKFGKLEGPNITLDNSSGTIYQNEKFPISGTISDKDSSQFTLYLQMDDSERTLIPLKKYTDIPLGEVQNFEAEIEGQDFTLGAHTVSIIGIDETGVRSSVELELTIEEFNATPAIQKVELGASLSTDIQELFEEITGIDVTLKNKPTVDSSKIGFQWAEAILVDVKNHELKVKIPVNIYNSESTVFDDGGGIALDARNATFGLLEVETAINDGTVDEMVREKVTPKSWNMEDGTENTIEILNNQIEPIYGDYTADIQGISNDNGAYVEKTVTLSVGGTLEFKAIPDQLSFENKKIGDKIPYAKRKEEEWKIEIENTSNTNWLLNASVTAFKGTDGEELADSLVYKSGTNQEIVLNSTPKKITAGDSQETYPVIQWEDTEGLLLKMNPDVKVGKYKGTIDWSLVDAPS